MGSFDILEPHCCTQEITRLGTALNHTAEMTSGATASFFTCLVHVAMAEQKKRRCNYASSNLLYFVLGLQGPKSHWIGFHKMCNTMIKSNQSEHSIATHRKPIELKSNCARNHSKSGAFVDLGFTDPWIVDLCSIDPWFMDLWFMDPVIIEPWDMDPWIPGAWLVDPWLMAA